MGCGLCSHVKSNLYDLSRYQICDLHTAAAINFLFVKTCLSPSSDVPGVSVKTSFRLYVSAGNKSELAVCDLFTKSDLVKSQSL